MSDHATHLPPTNYEAEAAIIGAMMNGERAITAADDAGLKAQHFHRQSHRLVFDAIRSIVADGLIPEDTMVVQRLSASKHLADAGGTAHVLSLSTGSPSTANAKAFAAAVVEAYRLRSMQEAGHAIARMAYERPDTLDGMLNRAGVLVAELGASGVDDPELDGQALLASMMDEWDDRFQRGDAFVGLSCGLPAVDELWGNLQGGKLTIVCGRPGMGKSVFVVQVAEHVAATQQVTALVFSGEMGRREVFSRLVSAVAQVDGRRLTQRVPYEHDFPKLQKAIGEVALRTRNLKVVYAPGLTPQELRNKARWWKRKLAGSDAPLGLVVVDYLQIMEPDGGRRGGNRTEDVSQISRSLKNTAMELDVPVVAASQLNRSLEARQDKRPVLSDLRESGSLEQDADAVLALYRHEVYDDSDPAARGAAEVIVRKNRGGALGTAGVGFQGEFTRFTPSPMFIAGGGLQQRQRAPRVIGGAA